MCVGAGQVGGEERRDTGWSDLAISKNEQSIQHVSFKHNFTPLILNYLVCKCDAAESKKVHFLKRKTNSISRWQGNSYIKSDRK